MPRRIFVFCAVAVSVVIAAVLFWPRSVTNPMTGGASSVEPQTLPAQIAARGATEIAPPKEPATAIARFSEWTDTFVNTPAEDRRADLMTQGAKLARDRRTEMAELIKRDPKAALEAAVPMALRQRLPQAIVDQLEERISGRGFYGVLIATDFEKMTSEVRREVVIGNETYDAFVYGRRSAQVTQERVPLWGIAVPNPAKENGPKLLALHENPLRPLERGETVPASPAEPCPVSTDLSDSKGSEAYAEVGGKIEKFCMASHIYLLNDRLAADIGLGGSGGSGEVTAKDSWSQGPKTCLYMRVAFPDDPSEPITEDEAYARMDEVNQWFIETSYDSTQIVPTVTPLLMLPYPKSFYSEQGTGRLLSDAREAARQQANLDTDNFTWDIVRHTSVPGFNYGGLGFIRGKGVWLASSSTGVACHELGHNYGLWHANSWNASGDSIIDSGSHSEYGNSFDTMGAADANANHFNAAFKYQLDWLPESFIHNVTSNGVYRIYTFDAPSILNGQKYALRVRKDYDRNYWAEFRERFPNRWFVNGVILNWDPWDNGLTNSAGGTHLLDTTPGTPDGKNDCPVIIGRTYSDVAAGVHITPLSRGSGGENWIDVAVNLGAFPGNTPPIASLIADRTSVSAGANVNFTALAYDADGDPLAYAWDFGDLNFGPNAPSVSKNWPAGEYTVRCTVSDMRGGTYTAKVLITSGTAASFRVSGRIIDEEGAPVEGVRVHNGQSGSGYRGTYTDSDGYYILPNNPSGSHTINAVKYGYSFTATGWANPVVVGPHATNRNFNATAMPVVAIEAVDAQAGETTSATGRFLLTRTGPTTSPLAVKLNRGGTATANTDYTLSLNPTGSPLQYTIPAGAASLSITVTPVSDTSAEGPETVMLTLQHDQLARAYALGAAEAIVTIVDDESPSIPSVDISASTPQLQSDNLATESGSDSAVFTFTRTGSVAGELAVSYSIGGTATDGVDYEDLSGVITIPAGQSMAVLPFRIIDDIEVENNETVTLTILASTAYTGAGDSTTITIVDDDLANVFVTASDDTARENNASGGTFVISRIGRLDVNLQVNYTLEGTASPGADYPALSGTIIIPAGSATADLPVTAINDGLNEGEETVVLRLSSSASYNVGNPGTATIIIVDDEGANVTLSASDANAAETANPGVFTFSRTGGTLSAPLVVYFTVNGTATRGVDYTDIPDFVTIPAGASSFVLPITPINDAINEGSERVTLMLAPAPEYTVATTTPQTVTITSDDTGLVGIGFTSAESSGNETVTGPLLSVQLSEDITQPVSVNYAVSGGSATGGGVDYTLAAGTLTFLPSTNNQSIRLTIVNDTALETNETIRVTLSSPANAVLDGIATHTYTIIDDDRYGNVTVTATTPNALEAGTIPGVFRIQRSGSSISNLVVEYQILGSASSPADYDPIPRSVTIPIGASFVDVTITPVDDSTDETNETVTLNLLNAPGGRLASPSDTATVTIIDDDSSASLATVSIMASDNVASEPGADTGTFTISRSGDTSADLTILYTVSGTAGAADYASIGTSATIPAGSIETTITVTPTDDAAFETNETVIVTLTLIESYRVGVQGHATVVIEDNEVGVSIASDGSSSEDGSSNGSFLISRTGRIDNDLTVNFVVSGTATRTNDFTAFGASVVIPAGTNTASIPVTAVDDIAPEGIETVVVALTAGAGYTVRSPNSATLLILDDEAVVTVTASDDTAHESGGNGAFTIARSGSVANPLTVLFNVTGTASNGVDYASLPSQAVIPAGTNATTLIVTPIDDDLVEGTEVVSITLNTNAAYALGSPASALVTLVDNEVNLAPAVQLVSPSADVIFLPSTNLFLVLESRISDDGRPAPSVVTSLWTRVSGPAGSQANFAGANSTNSFVRFNMNGVYVLRLTAGDGQLATSTELTVVVNGNAMLTNGLQAHWRFDETGGTTAADASGNNRNGTMSGATFVTGGRFGNAAQFDGVDDIMNFTSPPATQVSFSAWVNTTGDGDSTTPRIIATPGYNVRLRRDSGGLNVAFEAERTTSPEWRTPLGSYTDNTWHHILVAYDSATATTPAMYIDGEPQTVTERTAGSGTQASSAGAASIGNQAALDRSLLGRVDEVRMYNRVLTAGEAALLSMGLATNTAPAVNAGLDRSGSADIALTGVVTDDGRPNPPGAVSNYWTKFSGPGTVTFSDQNAAATTATFSEVGTYVLSLHSTDGQVKVFDQVTITVVNPPMVQVQTMATPGTEFGATSGRFMISRNTGNFTTTVFYTLGGTASNGLDYVAVSNQVIIGPGQFSANVTIAPVLDSLAEGDETVTLTITPHASYVLGQISSTNLTISDRPLDSWRFGRFSPADLSNALVSGDSADPDGDAIKNLMEYALDLDPKSSNALSGFFARIENVSGADALVVTHKRRKAPRDIDYVVEGSSDLASWTSGAGVAQEISVTDDGNGTTETVRLRVMSDVTQSGGRRFVRLKVVKQ